MKKLLLFCVATAVFFAVCGCGKRLSREEMVDKGKYLVTACGVLNFHTPLKDGKPDMQKFMAGSNVGYSGPWGIYYPRNLTPDIDTGIGAMTDEEVISEIKGEGTGIKPGVFCDYYRNLTEEDLRCIVYYLRTLTAISNKTPDSLKPGEKPFTAVINLAPAAVKGPPPPAAKKAETKAPAKKASATSKKDTSTGTKKSTAASKKK
jgi:hypothetical protein